MVIPHTIHPVPKPGLHKQRGEIPPSTGQHKQQSGTADYQGSTNPAAAGDPVADDQSRDNSTCNIPPAGVTETAVEQNHDDGAIKHDQHGSGNLCGVQQDGAINPEVQHNNNQVMNDDSDGHIQPPGDNIKAQNKTDMMIKDNIIITRSESKGVFFFKVKEKR